MPPHAKQTTHHHEDVSRASSSSSSSSAASAFPPITRKNNKTAQLSQSSTKKKKSVTFFQSVKVQRVLHICNYTKEEIESTWYTSSEMSSIKKETKEAAKVLETHGVRKLRQQQNSSSSTFTEFCIRGLEHRTQQGAKQRYSNRTTSIQIVLEEQNKQKCQGINDVKQLSYCYISESRHCQILAHEIGMDDEYVVVSSS